MQNRPLLGPYELENVLGKGATGVVYRAYQPALDRYVALKVLIRAINSSITFDQRFSREASIAASLEHPHIVPVYDYGSTDEARYVAMRLLTGRSLTERLAARQARRQPYTPAEVEAILNPIADAMDYAHQRGVVHRDIKPSNIMFDDHDRPYLVDFGIARLVDTRSGLTQTGYALGTPAYMPPEQWMGKEATSPSDVYALGAVIFEMLTLHPPFEAENPYALMQKHIQVPPPLVSEYEPQLTPQIGLAVQQALQKTETERFPTAGEFAHAFSAATQGRTISTPRANTVKPIEISISRRARTAINQSRSNNKQPSNRRWSLLVGSVLLLGMLTCGGYVYAMRDTLGFDVSKVPAVIASTTETFKVTPSQTSIVPSPSFTPADNSTTTLQPTPTTTPTNTVTIPATLGDVHSINRATRPAPVFSVTTTQPATSLPAVPPTRVPSSSTPRPTKIPSVTPLPSTNTPTAIPPTPTSVAPTAIPPTAEPPTTVPPTAVPANSNGNSSGSGGSSNNGNSGGNSGGNGSNNAGGNGAGSGNGNGGGNGNGKNG
ncbi:MAG: protein kinase [Anaerolineae bacterium]